MKVCVTVFLAEFFWEAFHDTLLLRNDGEQERRSDELASARRMTRQAKHRQFGRADSFIGDVRNTPHNEVDIRRRQSTTNVVNNDPQWSRSSYYKDQL